MSDRAGIGVFVCECGDEIGRGVDVTALVAHASRLPNVAWAGEAGYWCLPASLERMRKVIADQHLDRVVIAGCSPRTQNAFFRRALDGLITPGLVDIVNLRDLAVHPHLDDAPGAAALAADQIAMAAADLALRAPGSLRRVHIMPHVVVIGGGVAGLTAALAVSEAGISVTMVEREAELGGQGRLETKERIAAIRSRANIQVLTGVQPAELDGTAGAYRLILDDGQEITAGAIIVATGAQIPDSRPRISDHAEHLAFVLCDMGPELAKSCLHTCCLSALRQATEIRRSLPNSEVTILFRELCAAGGAGEEAVAQARQLGVQFVRYPAGQMPQVVDGEIAAHDELTRRDMRLRCDQIIPIQLPTPQVDAAHLAKMLRLPIDSNGFIAEARLRLRPEDRIERGIYVCGAAHYPCDVDRAVFQAYSAAARAIQHIQREEIETWAMPAAIQSDRCNGCGDCARVCPFSAISVGGKQGNRETGRQGDKETGKNAMIDPMLCMGCGNCVSVCPVGAAQIASATDEQLEAQISVALGVPQSASHPITQSPNDLVTPSSRHLIFACEWSGYSAAEIAGARGLAYPATIRLIRVDCTGRLQPGVLLKALELGAAGVMILGCEPGACHYEQGNERAESVFKQTQGLGRLMGLDRRLACKWIPLDDGGAFVHAINEFVEETGRA